MKVVTAQVWIDVLTGKVLSANANSAYPAINHAVTDAALKTTFSPFVHGFDVFILGQLEFVFSPQNKKNIELGEPIELPKPLSPPGGTIRGNGVPIEVEIIVDEAGNVTAAKAVSGHPLLRAAGGQAARNSKFTPTKVRCKAVQAKGVISYNYTSYNKFEVSSVELSPLLP